MDQLHLLIFLSFAMLIGSFLSGTIPMAFKLSDNKSRLLALMGSGILVGTALAIIIPEGIDTIYAPPDSAQLSITGSSDGQAKDQKYQTPTQEPIETWVIGVSLVAGFILMLLVDQFSLYQNSSDVRLDQTRAHDYTLANQDEDAEEDIIGSIEDDTLETTSEVRPIRNSEPHRISIREPRHTNRQNSHDRIAHATKVTPTLGLVIHASADGIALGAAATTSHRDVEMIIFLAIMLHKAPAAFSLVVFLLHRGLKHSTIRRHLLAFSLSAPLAALLTYFGLSQSGKEALRRNNATGIAMLFSAGTFLYVATVHVLPELVHNRLLTPKELIFLVGGAFLPILLAQSV